MINKSSFLIFCICSLRRFLTLLVTFFVAVCVFYFYPVSAQDISKGDKIKASYVFNFIRFIKWPPEKLNTNKQPINICVINRSDNFVKAFQPAIGKKVDGHPLVLNEISDINDISSCHLVYIDKSEKKKVSTVLEQVEANKILSISDINTFCKQGGMIAMVNKKGTIKVEINLNVARKAGFHISSNLLEVAKIVTSE